MHGTRWHEKGYFACYLNVASKSNVLLLFCSTMSPHDFLLAFVPSSPSWRCSNCTAQTNFFRFFSIFKFSRNLDF